MARNQDGITARVIEERAFPRQPLTVAQLKGRHLPQPALLTTVRTQAADGSPCGPPHVAHRGSAGSNQIACPPTEARRAMLDQQRIYDIYEHQMSI